MSDQFFPPESQIQYAIPKSAACPSDDVEGARESHPLAEKEFLQVIDVPFGRPGTRSRTTLSASADIAAQMGRLPPHSENTARILDVTVHSDFKLEGLRDEKGSEATQRARSGLIRFLQATYDSQSFKERRIFRWLNDPILVNDIGSISSQWSQSLDGRDHHFYRLVNRSSLQQDPLDLDLRPRDSYMTCAQGPGGRLLVIIVHDVWFKQQFNIDKSSEGNTFTNPRTWMMNDYETSWTMFSNEKLETFAKLLVLDFFQASIYLQSVDYYEDLIYPNLRGSDGLKISLAKNPHLQVPLGLFEPRLSAKSREAFKEIADAEGILRSVNNLVDSISYVIEDLESDDTWGPKPQDKKIFSHRIKVLKALCKERADNAQRALDALNRQLDYLTKKHAINEAKAIRILTILASFYLPLSLSGTLLGMQTPFRMVAHDVDPSDTDELKYGSNLLFDFFGGFIVLATGTVIIVHVIRFGLWLRSNGVDTLSRQLGILPTHLSGPFSILSYGTKWRFDGRGGGFFQLIRVTMRWFIGLGFGITLLLIFIQGMKGEAQGAWDMARYIFAGYCSISGLLLILYLFTYIVLYRKSFGRRRLEVYPK